MMSDVVLMWQVHSLDSYLWLANKDNKTSQELTTPLK